MSSSHMTTSEFDIQKVENSGGIRRFYLYISRSNVCMSIRVCISCTYYVLLLRVCIMYARTAQHVPTKLTYAFVYSACVLNEYLLLEHLHVCANQRHQTGHKKTRRLWAIFGDGYSKSNLYCSCSFETLMRNDHVIYGKTWCWNICFHKRVVRACLPGYLVVATFQSSAITYHHWGQTLLPVLRGSMNDRSLDTQHTHRQLFYI